MKILQIIPANKKNNKLLFSNLIAGEIEGLKQKGCEIEYFYYESRTSVFAFFKSKKLLKDKLERFKPDIVHAHNGSSTGFLLASTKTKTPKIITFGGSDLLGNKHPNILWKLRSAVAVYLSKVSAKKYQGIICVSNNLLNTLPKSTLNNAVVIPRGIDISFFRPIPKAIVRHELSIESDEKIVLFSKNTQNSFVKNQKLADEVMFIICNKFGIKARLVYLINYSQKEILQWLNAADALLLTSFHEGSPNIVKEAMACNLPIVSVNCGDVKQRLVGVKNCQVTSYRANDLAQALKKILSSKQAPNSREILIKSGLDRPNTSIKILKFYCATMRKSHIQTTEY